MKKRLIAVSILFLMLLLGIITFCAPAHATGSITLSPAAYITTSGRDGGQPVSNLHNQDQSGTQNDWDKYVELTTPRSNTYAGYRTYILPEEVASTNITALQVDVNYLGPKKSYQTWTWQIRDFTQGTWVTIGDNASAADWRWSPLSFDLSGDFADYVSSSGEICIHVASNNTRDNADLDYEAVVVTVDDSPAPSLTNTATLRPPTTLPPTLISTIAPTTVPPTTVPPTLTSTSTPTMLPPTTMPPTLTMLPPTLTNTSIPPTMTPPAGIWQPAPGTSWQWQLTDTIDTSFEVDMYDIDLFEVPQTTIEQLKADGRIVICYFSAGSWEDWRPDAGDFPALVKGRSNGWPGEVWLDIRNISVLGPIMKARMDLAVQKGCHGVEPDNIDGYTNNTGFPLDYQDQIDYNVWLAREAHARGLSIGLKNDVEQVPDLVDVFDWALNEQCFEYDECDTLLPFVQAGKAVFGVEYTGSTSSFCPQANAMGFDWLKKNLDLDAYRVACR
ncbi:MAG: endo alpha-1,4 polygalactosaminidase [Anaerolineae bacterium]|nr:endo alpha-1,4 polygalactosaminidase [Anaerolineae bacterium]